jgi:hypothetical protein
VTWCILVLLGSTAAQVHGQWPAKAAPADSPAWWTLSPEVTPAELRDELLNPEKVRARYLEAVRLGLQPAVSEEELQRLEYFDDGQLAPELIPAWVAYQAFALELNLDVTEESEMRGRLVPHGLSEEAINLVLASTRSFWERRDRLIEEYADRQQEFVRIFRLARDRMGDAAYAAATAREDAEALARITRRTPEKIRRLAEVASRDLGRDAALPELVDLRQELSPIDWLAFLDFLREDIAAPTSRKEFRTFPR